MENKVIAKTFKLLAQLMELHNENPFRTKSVANAAFKIDKIPYPLANKTIEELAQIDGIGKSMATKVDELLRLGELRELQDLIAQTPAGVLEMLSIKGIGPKKIEIIWHQLGIETIGELYYACHENRLIEAKGFGEKTQAEIQKAIEFKMANNGKFLYATAANIIHKWEPVLHQWLNQNDKEALMGIAGDYRRACEVLEEVPIVIGTHHKEQLALQIGQLDLDFVMQEEGLYQAISEEGLKIQLYLTDKEWFYLHFFKLTGNSAHVETVLQNLSEQPYPSEEAIYQKAGLNFVAPELRENYGEIEQARAGQLPQLIEYKDLKGSLHNHSNWSDGVHSLEQMAKYCKEVLQLSYLGICDHSKSAFYANGLSEERVYAQQAQIDQLNQQLAPFRIFKGIECDILYSGELDYSNEVLKTFDFVVASVHSQLKMDKDKATSRLIKAIENPYTSILGHPTGRLLLSRKGYELDFKKVIDACAANRVAIEINANPLRLDLDWRWHRYALEKGVLLAINPDAHRTEGLHDMHYGTLVARKGGLIAKQCLNAMSLEEITAYFEQNKQ